MKRYTLTIFLSMSTILIHCAQVADANFGLIRELTEVEKLVYPDDFSKTISFHTRHTRAVYSKDNIYIVGTEGLFVHPLHECNMPRLLKKVCSSCYTGFFTKSLNVIKNSINNLKKRSHAPCVESAISKLDELSTRLSDNYIAAYEGMTFNMPIDNKPFFMELIYCATEVPTEVLNIIHQYEMLITTAKKADCYSFKPVKNIPNDPQYYNTFLKWNHTKCCDQAPKLLIPQQDIVTCVQFGNVRTSNAEVFSVAYEEGGIITECYIFCPMVCCILRVQKRYDEKYKDGEIYFPDNLPQPGENEIFGASDDENRDFVPRHCKVQKETQFVQKCWQ